MAVSVEAFSAARSATFLTKLPRWLFSLGAVAIAAAVLWSTLAPVTVGGKTSFVVTEGISMLPHYKADGVVVTRKRETYRVGDIVAYNNQEMGAVVLHRIVATIDGRFVMQGDNNDYRDTYEPIYTDILGAKIVYWPGLGKYWKFFRQPTQFAGTIAVVALLTLWLPRRSRRRRRHNAW